jgi:hypothetical protein
MAHPYHHALSSVKKWADPANGTAKLREITRPKPEIGITKLMPSTA